MARRRTSKLKFTGELAKPLRAAPLPFKIMPISGASNLGGLSAQARLQLSIYDQLTAHGAQVDGRLGLLADHFGIPVDAPDRLRQLVICLAGEVVPGFMSFKMPGAPRRWTPERLAALRSAVESMTDGGLAAMEACRRLLRNPDGSMRYRGCNSVRTLYRRYQDSKKTFG